MWCGHKMLPWRAFVNWCLSNNHLADPKTWKHEGHRTRLLSKHNAVGERSLNLKVAIKHIYMYGNMSRKAPDLLEILVLAKGAGMECANPLDVIFSILGLSGDASDFMPPDYTRSVSEIYSEVALTMIQRDQSLEILRKVNMDGPTDADRPTLPSWVPNWGATFVPGSELKFCATKNSTAVAKIRITDNSVLWTRGVICDRISQIEGPRFMEPSEIRWFKIILGQQSIYPTGIPQLQAFFRTLLYNYNPLTKTKLSPNDSSFFDLAAAFMYFIANQLKSISEIEHMSERSSGNEQPFEGVQDSSILESFLGSSDSEFAISWPDEIDLFKILDRGKPYLVTFMFSIRNVSDSRRLFVTNNGYMGLGPTYIEVGDLICVLFGCSVPLILRKQNDFYTVLGECFVLGLMDGEIMEALQEGTYCIQEFEIH
jgi:hypothetical protein